MIVQIRLLEIGEFFRIPIEVEYSSWNPYENKKIESKELGGQGERHTFPFLSCLNSFFNVTWEEYVDFLKEEFEDFSFLTFFCYKSQIKECAFPIAANNEYKYFNKYELFE